MTGSRRMCNVRQTRTLTTFYRCNIPTTASSHVICALSLSICGSHWHFSRIGCWRPGPLMSAICKIACQVFIGMEFDARFATTHFCHSVIRVTNLELAIPISNTKLCKCYEWPTHTHTHEHSLTYPLNLYRSVPFVLRLSQHCRIICISIVLVYLFAFFASNSAEPDPPLPPIFIAYYLARTFIAASRFESAVLR